MSTLDQESLEWRDGEDELVACRLYYKGEPSNVIKTHLGSVQMDTFPSEIYELNDDGVFREFVKLEANGLVRTTGSTYVKYRSPEELLQALERDQETERLQESLSNSSVGFIPPEPEPRKNIDDANSGFGSFAIPNTGSSGFSVERPKKQKSQLSPKKMILAGAIVLGLIGGTAVTINMVLNKDSEQVQLTNTLNIVGTTSSQLGALEASAKIEEVPTGWDKNNPNWKFKINSNSIAVSGFQVGIVLCDGKSLTILDPETGETRISVEIKGVPKFISTANLTEGDDPNKGIVWRLGDVLYVWNPVQNNVLYYQLIEGAVIDTSGTGILVRQSNESYVLTETELKKVKGSTGKEISSEGPNVIVASGWNGPISLKSSDGEIISESLLDPPEAGMLVNQWHGAGTGYAFISWKKANADTKKDDTSVVLATHDLETGKVVGKVEAKVGQIAGKKAKYGGADQQAAVGPYLFSLENGELLANASKDVTEFSLILADHAYGKKIGGGLLTYINGEKQERLTPNTPITVLDDGSSVSRVSPETIARLPKS